PAPCPVTGCGTVVQHTHLLRHMIVDHLDQTLEAVPFQLRLRQVTIGQKTLVMFYYRQLQLDNDRCLAVLNWLPPQPNLLPGPLSDMQLDLPPCHRILTGHLPILVMVCRTTWKSLTRRANRKIAERDASRQWGHVYLVWLVSPVTRRPVDVALGVLNRRMQYIELRHGRRVRNFGSKLPLQNFMNGLDPSAVLLGEDQLDGKCDGSGLNASVFIEITVEGESR
ncbi:hypothetical protein KR018_003680, partial [Drosophila ironensis]